MSARQRRNANSESVDNYLKAILSLGGPQEARVTSTALADRLAVAPASITNMLLYNQASAPPDGTATYLNVTAANVSVTNPGSGTDQYCLNIQVSGYSYTVLSFFIAGNFTGLPIRVSVPLGLYN